MNYIITPCPHAIPHQTTATDLTVEVDKLVDRLNGPEGLQKINKVRSPTVSSVTDSVSAVLYVTHHIKFNGVSTQQTVLSGYDTLVNYGQQVGEHVITTVSELVSVQLYWY